MGCITDGRGRHNRPPVRVMPRPHQPRQGRNDTAHRDERQRVREVAMVLDRQQGIRRTPDQDVGVWQHATDGAEQPRLAAKARAEGKLCGGRAEQCVSQGVHVQAPACGGESVLFQT